MSSHINTEANKTKPSFLKSGIAGALLLGGAGAYYFLTLTKKTSQTQYPNIENSLLKKKGVASSLKECYETLKRQGLFTTNSQGQKPGEFDKVGFVMHLAHL